MVENNPEILALCNVVHNIMQDATKDLPIPAPQNARDARKILSVFTYGIISALSAKNELDKDKVYEKYLMMGGLNTYQADIIVSRTRDEFVKRDFGEKCLISGKNAVNQWTSGDKDIRPLVESLLQVQ